MELNDETYQLTPKQIKLKAKFESFCLSRGLQAKDRDEVENDKNPGDSPGIMMAFFSCGHSLITSFTNYQVLTDINTSRTCGTCGYTYWLNKEPNKKKGNFGVSCVEYVAAVSYGTRRLQSELLYELSPVNKPLNRYNNKETLVQKICEYAAEFEELDKPQMTTYPNYYCDGGIGVIYVFIKDDCMAYIGSTSSLERRWISSVGGQYTQDYKGDTTIIIPMKDWLSERLRRLQEIEKEFIKRFRTSQGWGYNVMGGGYSGKKYVL